MIAPKLNCIVEFWIMESCELTVTGVALASDAWLEVCSDIIIWSWISGDNFEADIDCYTDKSIFQK